MNALVKKHPSRFLLLVIFHALALAAPFCYTWQGLVAFLVLYFVTGCLGVTVGYHRLLSHQSFKTHSWIKNTLMLFGALTFEGNPAWWVLNHRLHHQYSDLPEDPHSPKHGFWHSQILWMFSDDPRWRNREVYQQVVPHLVNDPMAKFLYKALIPINLLFLLGLFGLGYAWGGWPLAWSLIIWGGFFRMVCVWHASGLIGSAAHIWGYRNYDLPDNSRNNWWTALVTYGDGWQNNHHITPSSATNTHRWWEFDATYLVIRIMELCGLAWDVNTDIPGKTPNIPSTQAL